MQETKDITAKNWALGVTSLASFMMALDAISGKVYWDKPYEGGCDRMAVSPDGKTLYVPQFEGPFWTVVNAANGNITASGTLTGLTGLTVNSGGASITGGYVYRGTKLPDELEREIEVELNGLAEQAAEQNGELRQHVAECQLLRAQGLLAREGKQLAYQARGPVRVLLDVHDVLEGRIGWAVVHQQEVGEADDRRQHVVEVVRDAAGELADGLHLLRLQQCRLHALLLGDVLEDAEQPHALVVADLAFAGRAHPLVVPLRRHEFGFEVVGVAGRDRGIDVRL